ncbi:MAG: competence/damage-inducible protein A [Chthonomonadales bacterium]
MPQERISEDRPLRAEVVSVGTELLMGQTVDTNAARLGIELSALGVSLYRRTTVGDNHDRLFLALRAAILENDIVITIGGLGPTMDDITRDVLAEAMGDTLVKDQAIADRLAAWFKSRGAPLLESNLRQAMVPTSGSALDNPNGTAPGLYFHNGSKHAFALPGPPNEFIPMLKNEVVPRIRKLTGGKGTIRSRVLRVCNMGESAVEEVIKDLILTDNPTVAPYAKTGEVHLRVSARADDPAVADAMVEERVEMIVERLGDHVYAFDDEPLESSVVRLFRERGLTLATAESCTGGMVSSRITDIAGSSAVLIAGAVTYSNEAKTAMLGVPAELIDSVGAVSKEVAIAMATGASERFGVTHAIGITGIAGPDGGTTEKPVGLVYIALATADGVKVERNVFIGIRADVRRRASQVALVMLRDSAMLK